MHEFYFLLLVMICIDCKPSPLISDHKACNLSVRFFRSWFFYYVRMYVTFFYITMTFRTSLEISVPVLCTYYAQ